MVRFSNTRRSASFSLLSRQTPSFCITSHHRFFLALLLPLVVMVLNMTFRPQQSPLLVSKESLGGGTPTVRKRPQPRTPPRLDRPAAKVFTTKAAYSDAPKPIELKFLSTNNTASSSPLERAVQQRHQCLSFIRQRHATLLAPLVQRHSNNVLLVDPAYHANVGDHMLTVAEQLFLQNYTAKWQECDYIQANQKAPRCESVIGSSSADAPAKLAMWHAGGNWGDLWRIAQEKRIMSLLPLLTENYTIVSMPQSFHYQNNDTKRQDAALIQRQLEQGLLKGGNLKEQVIFTWREEYSFQRAQELYPYVTNLLLPDIAFQLGPYERTNPPTVDILVFLRNDLESKYTEQRNTSYIQEKLKRSNMTFTMVDWPDRLEKFDSQDILFTHTSIQLLSLGKVVIADRLHASILAYLTGLPFVYLDQSTNKLTKTLSAAFDSWPDGCHNNETSLWSKATNLDEALEKAVHYIEHYRL